MHTHAKRSSFSNRLILGAAGVSLFAAFGAGADAPQQARVAAGAPLANAPQQLIPRAVLFGNPERAGPEISPDGKRIAYLAPVDGVLNVWVADLPAGATAGAAGLLSDLKAKALTSSKDRPIRDYSWAVNGEQILYSQDKGGNENFHVYAVDLATGAEKDLTPGDQVKASIMAADVDRPDEILVTTNARDPQVMDVYRVNTRTGAQTRIFENDGGWISMVPDHTWTIRARQKMLPDGSTLTEARESADAPWFTFLKVPFEDAQGTSLMGFTKDNKEAWMIDSRNRDTSGLFRVVPQEGGGTPKLVFASDKADVADAMENPVTRDVDAVASEYLRKEWKVLNPAIQKDLDALRRLDKGDISVSSRTKDDSRWVVSFLQDAGAPRWWLWDRAAGKGTYLGTSRPALAGLPLRPMEAVEITARDGLTLTGYLTLPANGASKAPMILFVHGGPWARDSWGYNPYHQWLANRGYAVLSVNFRGSTGFGKKFLNAGNRQWYAAMQDDLVDAVNWAVKKGYADPSKVAIMGGSYGGYATLAGLTRDPELFACGVDIVGPSHIATLLKTIPPYWKPLQAMFETRVGRMEEGSFLDSISPLTHTANIKRPLLIGQGANDPRVKVSESDQIVAAMKEKNLPVTYVVFPDEGHGFAKPTNNMGFNAITEQFLARHLGGRAEPIGEDVKKSTAQVRELGGLELPGVKAWDPSQAPGSKPAAAVDCDSLDPTVKANIEAALKNITSQMAPEMLPMLIEQMRSQVEMAPEKDRAAFLCLLKKLEEAAAKAVAPKAVAPKAPAAPAGGNPAGGGH